MKLSGLYSYFDHSLLWFIASILFVALALLFLVAFIILPLIALKMNGILGPFS